MNSLQDDYYRYDAKAHTLAGHRTGNSFRLGDVVKVEIARVDVDRRALDFRLVKRVGKAPPRAAPVATNPPTKKNPAGRKQRPGRAERQSKRKK